MKSEAMQSEPIYLNQAGTSWPKPASVLSAMESTMLSSVSSWTEAFESAHHDVCEFFSIQDSSRLLLTPGCTSALSLAISDFPWSEGDRIAHSGWEHHALHRQIGVLQRQGVTAVQIPPGNNSTFDLDFLEDKLRRTPIRMVAITEFCNVTGDRLPIDQIAWLAHQHDARVLVDGAQAVGWQDQNLTSSPFDIYCFGSHKQLHSGWGVGGLYVAANVTLNSPAASCSTANRGSGTIRHGPSPCGEMPGYCDGGSVDRATLAGLKAAVKWLRSANQVDRFHRTKQFAGKIRNAISLLPDVRLYGQMDDSGLPTIAFNLGDVPSIQVAQTLAEFGLMVAGGQQCAPLAHQTLATFDQGVVRISLGAMTEQDEIDDAIARLAEATPTLKDNVAAFSRGR